MWEYTDSGLYWALVVQGLDAGLAGTSRTSGIATGERIAAAHPVIGSGQEGQSVPMGMGKGTRTKARAKSEGEHQPEMGGAKLRLIETTGQMADDMSGMPMRQTVAGALCPERATVSLMCIKGGKP